MAEEERDLAPEPKEGADSIVQEAMEAFKECEEAWSHNRKSYLEDLKFARLAEQWPGTVQRDRENEGRPALTVNLLPAFLRQVVNDARMNKPAIKVHPADDKADPETAEIINGLIRNIWNTSNGDVAGDTAMDTATSGGFGFMGVNLKYASDDTFDKDIVIEAKPNPLAIYGDPNYSGADSSDWNVAFEVEEMTQKQFERRWKGAKKVDWQSGAYSVKSEWVYDKKVRVAAWWERQEVRKKLLAVIVPAFGLRPGLESPLPIPVDPEAGGFMPVLEDVYAKHKAFFDEIGARVEGRPRDVLSHKVTQRIMSGVEELDRIEWAGRFIPLVPVYGDVVNVEGKVYLRSLIRDAKDSQQQCNFWESAATEAVANAPKAPFVGPEEAFLGVDAQKWATANRKNHPYLSYPAYDEQGRPIPPPSRQAPAFAAAAEMQMALAAHERIKAITGLHNASLGERSNETSGRAILARQREGDTSTFHFSDNLARAFHHLGAIIVDLIPHTYGYERIGRVLGLDGKPRNVRFGKVPPEQAEALKQAAEQGQDGQEAAEVARIYDVTVGKYDLVVETGPSFATKREEAASQMIELIRNYPAAAPLIGDLLAKNLDWPGADEIAQRLKAMLPAQIQGQNPEVVAAQQQLQALQAELQKMAAALQEAQASNAAELAKVREEAEQADKKLDLEAKRVEIEAFKAETDRMKMIAPKGVGLPPEAQGEIVSLILQTIQHLIDSPDMIEGEAHEAMESPMEEAMEHQGFTPEPGEILAGYEPPEAPEELEQPEAEAMMWPPAQEQPEE